MTNVEDFLKSKGVEFILHEHPAVYTCEEAEKYCGDIPGLACKNLLLKGKKSGQYFLIILPAEIGLLNDKNHEVEVYIDKKEVKSTHPQPLSY